MRYREYSGRFRKQFINLGMELYRPTICFGVQYYQGTHAKSDSFHKDPVTDLPLHMPFG